MLPEGTLANSSMHLYGGAQLHRAMTEFRLVVGQVSRFKFGIARNKYGYSIQYRYSCTYATVIVLAEVYKCLCLTAPVCGAHSLRNYTVP